MSDDGRGRASLGVKVWKSSQKWSVHRSAVRSIAWLDVGSPSVDQTADNKAADPAEDKDRNILVCNDGVWKADEKPEEQPDQPAGPERQLHATNNESNGEATGESAE
jgi:hypothetical protein